MVEILQSLEKSILQSLFFLEEGLIATEMDFDQFQEYVGFMRKLWELSISIQAELLFNQEFNQGKVDSDLLSSYLQTRFTYLELRIKEKVKEFFQGLKVGISLPSDFLQANSAGVRTQVQELSEKIMSEVKKAYKGLGEVEGVYPETDLWANMQDFFVLGVEDLLDFPSFLLSTGVWLVIRNNLDKDDDLLKDLEIAWNYYVKNPTFELQAVFRQSIREDKLPVLTKKMLSMAKEVLKKWTPWFRSLVSENLDLHKQVLCYTSTRGALAPPFLL